MRLAAVLVIAAACHHAGAPPAATTGAIAGQVRDHDTGAQIASAQLAIQREGTLRPTLVTSDPDGAYELLRLPPGRYDVTASYAGVTVDVHGVAVTAGHTIGVDVDLALGRPADLHLDFGDPHEGDLRHYRPRGANPTLGAIEGTVTDAATRERVPGAVVTATEATSHQTQQVITDDRGHFAIASLPPGEYSVSAYYTIARHGTIEVEHNRVPVRGGEAAVVPLFVELTQ